MGLINKFRLNFQKIAAPLGYVMGVASFVCSFVWWPGKIKIYVFTVIIFLTLIIVSLLTFLDLRKETQYSKLSDQNIIVHKLTEAMKKWFDEQKFGDVVTFGKALGRALYISACYKTRIEIGKLIEEAAKHLDDDLLLVNVLLDDIGWTEVLCGYADAEKHIKEGIELAEEKKYYKEVSKGNRHLAAIEISNNNTNEAKKYLEKAYAACNSMENGRSKDITLSGLLYASSELAYKRGNYDEAMEKAKESETMRKKTNEIDRHMRYYAQIGKIELHKPNGKIKDARKHFNDGIEESKNVNRIDELVKNAYGYAICCIKLKESKKITERVEMIIKEYGNIPLYSEDELLRTEYNKLLDKENKDKKDKDSR